MYIIYELYMNKNEIRKRNLRLQNHLKSNN